VKSPNEDEATEGYSIERMPPIGQSDAQSRWSGYRDDNLVPELRCDLAHAQQLITYIWSQYELVAIW